MARRSRAREVALQLLYQDDLNPGVELAVVEEFLRLRLRADDELFAFALSLVEGVRRHRGELDSLLTTKAANWALARMAALDRNIIRLGAFEILHTQTPGAVVINEAVELAKRYGSAQSPQFVNGVLDRCLRDSDR